MSFSQSKIAFCITNFSWSFSLSFSSHSSMFRICFPKLAKVISSTSSTGTGAVTLLPSRLSLICVDLGWIEKQLCVLSAGAYRFLWSVAERPSSYWMVEERRLFIGAQNRLFTFDHGCNCGATRTSSRALPKPLCSPPIKSSRIHNDWKWQIKRRVRAFLLYLSIPIFDCFNGGYGKGKLHRCRLLNSLFRRCFIVFSTRFLSYKRGRWCMRCLMPYDAAWTCWLAPPPKFLNSWGPP